MKKILKLNEIIVDALRTRVKVEDEIVAEYAAKMTGGEEFPPGRVFRVKQTEDGKTTDVYYLTEGEHRLAARKSIGQTEAEFEVVAGSLAEALLDALGSNDDHGLRLSNKDKRHKILLCLENLEKIPGASNSSRYVAETCKVSAPLVEEVRVQWEAKQAASGKPVQLKRKGKDGMERAVRTKEEAAQKKAEKAAAKFLAKEAREKAKAEKAANIAAAKEGREKAKREAAAQKERLKREAAEAKEAAEKKAQTPAFAPEFSTTASSAPEIAADSPLHSQIGEYLVSTWHMASDEVRQAFRDYIA